MKLISIERFNIRQLILGVSIFSISILTFLIAYISSQVAFHEMNNALYQQTLQVTKRLAKDSIPPLLYDSKSSAKDVLDNLSLIEQITDAQIMRLNGKPLLKTTEVKSIATKNVSHHYPRLAENKTFAVIETSKYWYFSVLVISQQSKSNFLENPFEDDLNTRLIPLGSVNVTVSKSGIFLSQRRIFIRNFIISIIIGLILMILTYIVLHNITRPLDELSHLMEQGRQGHYPDQISLKGSKEIIEMSQTFKAMISAIKEREQNLSLTLNSIGDAVIVTDNKGIITRMNPVAQNLTGWKLEQVKGQSIKDIFSIIDATTRQAIKNPIDIVLDTEEVVYLSNHTTLIARDKTEYQIADSAAPILNNNGKILGMILVFNDVTEQYQLREQAKNSILQVERMIDNIKTSVSLVTPNGKVILCNKALSQLLGMQLNQLVGNIFWDILAFSYDSKVNNLIHKYISKAVSGKAIKSTDIQLKTPQDLHWVSFGAYPVFDEKGQVINVLIEVIDIESRKEAEKKVTFQANYDALTELPNRLLCNDRLNQLLQVAKREEGRVAVFFLDLDFFKNYNDTLGHEAGDTILKITACRLKKVIRSSDTVGRLGGDEFIIILSDISNANDVHFTAENILKCIQKTYLFDGKELKITASLGISIYPDNGLTAKELLRHSDMAMYDAKENGRNIFSFYTKEMNDAVSSQMIMEEQLVGALERNEFMLYYQPKIKLSNGKIIGAEALLRWHNIKLGNIPPDIFIPLCEKNGFIHQLGDFVLGESMNKLREWKKELSDDFCMAINLSPVQFNNRELLSNIKTEIKKNNIHPFNLELEITENTLINRKKSVKILLEEISSMGILIAMDDFGTGYSSLNYLRQYPFDVLKIDKSFVMDMTEDIKDWELVNAAVSMAKGLGLKTVAEGVETKEQLELLKKMNCEYVQGYLFGKPMPASEFIKLFWTMSDRV